MATTLGPDRPVEASHVADGFAESSSHRHIPGPIPIPIPIPRDMATSIHLSGGSPQSSSPRSRPPLPNPPFVFPVRPSSSSAPSSYSRASGRRPRSAVELPDRSSGLSQEADRPLRSPALPDFSFNPGAGLSPASAAGPEHAFLSPPQSPQSPRAIPARPTGTGHRRGGSEFVGGNIRAGDSITVMSTSPTKSESGFASPQLAPVDRAAVAPAPTAPGPGRRGHAHRRSAAISSHDLSMILKPATATPSVSRGSSAPPSPADFERKQQFTFPATKDEIPKSEEKASPVVGDVGQASVTLAITPTEEPKQSLRPAARARVGFSDTLEFIPRPLSLVSSDTSSTITGRPGHSVSGSISSIISLSNSPATDRETISPIVRSPSRASADSRPSTAGPILERTQSIVADEPTGPSPPRRRNSIPLLASLPTPEPTVSPATPSPSKTPKRWSFFGLEPFIGTSSPTRSRPVSASSSEVPPNLAAPAASPRPSAEHASCPLVDISPEETAAATKAPSRKASKKKKKTKVWSGSILTRKGKARRKSRRAPTPPPLRSNEAEDEGVEDYVDMVPEGLGTPVLVITESDSPDEEAKPWHESSIKPQDDVPMIDLDAALGPFNTPLPRNAEWEAAQRAGGLAKRQLHSAAGLTRFTGPGMHYSHRRAESAPEMPPFNRAGMPRFNSSSTMADVFEEDEEDDDDSDQEEKEAQGRVEASTTAEKSVEKDEKAPSINIHVADSGDEAMDKAQAALTDDAASSIAMSRRGSGLSGLSDDDKTQPSTGLKSEYSASSLHEEVIVEEDTDRQLRSSDSGCFNMADGYESATPSPGRLLKGKKDLAPVDVSPLHLPTPSLAPVSPYSLTHSSAFPSPRSPMSYDANRISTAPSSVTEDNFQSLLMGEPGPEVRLSIDIPSLTSSNSTMTRESAGGFGQTPLPQPRGQLPFRGERPASFSSTAFGRRRSSLASLHRLISTSHGERSKLSMEVTCDVEPEKKAPKVSKAKRLSRMVQFWKPKDNTSSA